MKAIAKISQGKPATRGVESNPAFRAETAPGRKLTCEGGDGSQNRNGREARAFNGGLMGFKKATKSEKAKAAQLEAKRVKDGLIAQVKKAISEAPSLEELLRGFPMATIKTPRGYWRVYNYKERLIELLSKVKRLQVHPGDHVRFTQAEPISRAEGRRFLREAARLARNGARHG